MRTIIELPPVDFSMAKCRKLRRKAVIRRLAWALLLGGSLAGGAVLWVIL